jgi:hypothetical protein
MPARPRRDGPIVQSCLTRFSAVVSKPVSKRRQLGSDAGNVKILEAFVIDTDGWAHADMVQACRLILRTVELSAKRCETYIPTDSQELPPDVVAAAEVLRRVAVSRGRVEGPDGYAQTGILDAAQGEVWSAFVVFAPWAYDATVWNASADRDCGSDGEVIDSPGSPLRSVVMS